MKESFDSNGLENIKVSVEIAGPGDLKDYKEIRLEALKEYPNSFGKKFEDEIKKTDKKWKKELENPSEPVLLAKEKLKTVGMASFYQRQKEKNSWCIISLYVSTPFQGKGIGEKIVNKAEEEIKKRGGEKAVSILERGVRS